MTPSASDKSPLERFLDAAIYAPLGYVVRRDEVRQDLADAGRKQVAFARSLGRAALTTMSRGVRQPDAATPEADTAGADSGASSVAGFSEMTAREIVALMPTAPVAQARWVLAEETSGKNRVTVVRAANARIARDD